MAGSGYGSLEKATDWMRRGVSIGRPRSLVYEIDVDLQARVELHFEAGDELQMAEATAPTFPEAFEQAFASLSHEEQA